MSPPRRQTNRITWPFYFTRAFGDERWAIHCYAPVRGHELARRRDLLPDEADHPRADQANYQLGPLERLDPPIVWATAWMP